LYIFIYNLVFPEFPIPAHLFVLFI